MFLTGPVVDAVAVRTVDATSSLAASMVSCAAFCLNTPACRAFSFSQQDNLCSAYDVSKLLLNIEIYRTQVSCVEAETGGRLEVYRQPGSVAVAAPGGCPCTVTVAEQERFSDRNPAEAVLTRSLLEKKPNYWIGRYETKDYFILDLGCKKNFSGVEVVNTHRATTRDMNTAQFR